MGRAIALGTAIVFAEIICVFGAGTARAQVGCIPRDATKGSAQEQVVQRDIQEAIDRRIEELGAKDLAALSREVPQGFTLQLLDGTTLNRAQAIEGMRQQLESVLSIDVDRTYTRIECLALMGNEATVYTKEQYVRSVPDRKDGSPHEVITSVRHRETWGYSKDGWVARQIQEIEQGPTYLDGELYDQR
jgi:hypothetical protein